jgi:hypothetical protein
MQMCVESACQEEEEPCHYHVVHRVPLYLELLCIATPSHCLHSHLNSPYNKTTYTLLREGQVNLPIYVLYVYLILQPETSIWSNSGYARAGQYTERVNIKTNAKYVYKVR